MLKLLSKTGDFGSEKNRTRVSGGVLWKTCERPWESRGEKRKSDAESTDLEGFEKIKNDFDYCDIWGWFGDLSVIMW